MFSATEQRSAIATSIDARSVSFGYTLNSSHPHFTLVSTCLRINDVYLWCIFSFILQITVSLLFYSQFSDFRSSLRDSEEALKLKPEYDKVLTRAANCSFELKQYSKCIEYCDKILDKHKSDSIILELRNKSIREGKLKERNERKKDAENKKQKKDVEDLLNNIVQRGYKLEIHRGGK